MSRKRLKKKNSQVDVTVGADKKGESKVSWYKIISLLLTVFSLVLASTTYYFYAKWRWKENEKEMIREMPSLHVSYASNYKFILFHRGMTEESKFSDFESVFIIDNNGGQIENLKVKVSISYDPSSINEGFAGFRATGIPPVRIVQPTFKPNEKIEINIAHHIKNYSKHSKALLFGKHTQLEGRFIRERTGVEPREGVSINYPDVLAKIKNDNFKIEAQNKFIGLFSTVHISYASKNIIYTHLYHVRHARSLAKYIQDGQDDKEELGYMFIEDYASKAGFVKIDDRREIYYIGYNTSPPYDFSFSEDFSEAYPSYTKDMITISGLDNDGNITKALFHNDNLGFIMNKNIDFVKPEI
jgi:hypothetical protein